MVSVHALASFHKDRLFYLILLNTAPILLPHRTPSSYKRLADFLRARYDFI